MNGIDTDLLSGKVIWVTASARGLGRAIAERLAHCGASIVVHSRSDKTAAEFGEAPSTRHVTDEIAKIGNPVTTVFADVSNPDQVQAAVEQIESDLGPIDMLVNNAGGDIAAKGGKPEPNNSYGISPEDVQSVVDRNLITTVDCCRQVIPGMIERGNGRIVNSMEFLERLAFRLGNENSAEGEGELVAESAEGAFDTENIIAYDFPVTQAELLDVLQGGDSLVMDTDLETEPAPDDRPLTNADLNFSVTLTVVANPAGAL